MISKNLIPPPDVVNRAADELRRLVSSGTVDACEVVLGMFPELHTHRDSVLEIIYLDYVLGQDRGSNGNSSEVVAQYARRFPDYSDDIVKLLQVDLAFNSLNPDNQLLVSGELSADSMEKWGPSVGAIGDYRLLEVLGRGGMGIVYRAIQERLGRVVAIKTIQVTEGLDAGTILRFQKEAEFASSLQHPNIAQIYEVGTHNEIPFYSMEYVSAGSLAQFLRDRPLRPELAASLVAVLARAIDYAHAQDVLHRDLKPANILLSPSTRPEALEIPDLRKVDDSKSHRQSLDMGERYEPKIVDFGLATHLSLKDHARTGQPAVKARAVGTPSYMAPEQVDAMIGPAGPWTDVYALGSILYHALVGRPPFYAATTQETLQQVCQADPIPPSDLQPRIANDLETICLKCLRKAPAARYQTALELANDLQRYLQGKPIQARPASVPERVYKWGVRHPSLVCLMAAMLIAVLLTTWLWQRSEQSLNAALVERMRGEQLNYDRNITLAYHEFKSHNVERSLELLDQCPPSYRNWEWDFVRSLCEEPLWQCEAGESKSRLVTACLSPDGKRVAMGFGLWGIDTEEAVSVWSTETNKLLWELRGHPPSEVMHVQFHPSKARLLSSAISWENHSSQPGCVIEWDLETGTKLRMLTNTNAHVSIYSGDGKRIYIGETTGYIKVLDAESGELQCRSLSQHGQMVLAMCESSDGKFLATTGRDGTIAVWCTATAQRIAWLENMGDPREIAWSPDMKKLVVSLFGGQVDTFRWKQNALEHESTVSRTSSQTMNYSPDGRFFATAALGDSTDLRDAETGRVIRHFHGHRGHIRAVSFDQYGRKLLTAGADGTCRLWDLTSIDGFVKKSLGSEGVIEAIDYHPKQQKFALGMTVLRSKPAAMSGRPRIEVWDSIRNRMTNRYLGHKDWLTTVRFSSDGERLVSGSLDKTVRIWDANSNAQLALLEGHQDRIVMACFWTNDRTVSVDASGLLKVWDNKTQQALDSWNLLGAIDGNELSLMACAMHENSGLLAVAESGHIAFWDLAKKEKLCSVPFADNVRELRFSWDGKLVAVASVSTDIPVFDVSALKSHRKVTETRRLSGHVREVTSLSFSHDDKRLAATGLDESLRVFELELGHEVLKIDDNVGTKNRVAFSRDGRQLTICEGRTVCTYSLDRLDHKAGQSPEQTITTWHAENYKVALERLQSYAASFHAKALVEREPESLAHKFKLAASLADDGKLEESSSILRSMQMVKARDQFARLNLLMRAYLLSKDVTRYSDCCLEYAALLTEKGTIDEWNDFAWYAALGASKEVDLVAAKKKLEGSLKQLGVEIAELDSLASKLKKIPPDPKPSDDQLKELGVTRQQLALTPAKIAEKKKSLQESMFLQFNTIALVYYRLGEYDNAFAASRRSYASSVITRPLDEIIEALALCRYELRLKADSAQSNTPPVRIPSNKLPKDPRGAISGLLRAIDIWLANEREKEVTVKKTTIDNLRIYQLEIPMLLDELQPLVDELGIDHKIRR